MYLYGPDSYRRQRALVEQIVNPYTEKYSGLSIQRFYLSEKEAFLNLKEFSSTTSLFAQVTLAIIYQPEAVDKKELTAFLKGKLEDKNTTIIVMADKKLTKEFSFLLKPPVKALTFELLIGSTFLSFIKQEAEKRKVKLSTDETKMLAQAYPGDSWSIVTELEKLALGAKFDVSTASPDFFGLIKSLRWGRGIGEKMSSLHFLLDNHEAALVFNMSASFMGAKEKPLMADYDVAIKSGKLDYPEALLDLVLS